MEFKPHKYQDEAINKIIEIDRCGLFLDMGLGKTVITLTAINDLMFNRFEVNKVVIIAPLKVAEDTWVKELSKWDHLINLSMSLVLGDKAKRIKALEIQADIYVINRENVSWLVTYLGRDWDFDMVVIDELSSFKNPSASRFKSLKKVIGKSSRVVGLTGTPNPNGYIDLWSQIYLLDSGERLGKTLSRYRDTYFMPDKRDSYRIFTYKLKSGADKLINKEISDICISMKAEDYLELPDKIFVNHMVSLQNRKAYDDLEKEFYFEFEKGAEVTASSKSVLINKLLQLSNGAVYMSCYDYFMVHDDKLNKLEELVESTLDSPILCFYQYYHDAVRIKSTFSFAEELSVDTIDRWNEGKIKLLLTHPSSSAYGLNLQNGGNIIVWFGLTWNLELYQQANARLHRQGQKHNVFIHHLICENTVEERVLETLQRKGKVQDELLDYLAFKYR
ncbi:SWI/SNF chromatin-remodeling complex subunit snf22 [Candidatus Arthromitus sp. SFB-mouse-SU]|uniref:SNF2-related protein n=1 Tax=Candidatus Arthromitus sp. SFB-mouse TaxID=49118 RepID=UPI0002251031|nr:SNF2-related protein [Candidatus Arthromitus sp. SFB-mouse]EIA23438.1 SWI/SNF chromatin-remodeling complex subunit snf22 [Candidatus Arthromitus sp. SFB-1]EIA25771.1 SWI/SNF chromatin-remodeling complex subunit snf22 [Candidatus Arthromitus sp. SFB-4]EIA26520.1 SWI/SNF chromatin-remodeling complex subunit snf22 [Candidatus Arthromitus sp. SFB-5]EIA28089.1 SWI/SNF chromatin-remodeling complex subunit snf22 [Candidatus Arthromitus sp. SFB-co]EIA31339.1 SWI/SNF chromatin-remodeling complex sub